MDKMHSLLRRQIKKFFGSADNNVHPSNTLQLAQALNRAGKSYEMMVGPDLGHAGVNYRRMWEFFIDTLILGPKDSTPLASRYHQIRAKRV